MADDITLRMNMDVSDADSAISRFEKSTQKAFNSSDKNIQKMGNSLNRVRQDIEKTRTKMKEVATIKQPTRDLEAMDLGIKQIESRLTHAKTVMGKFLASGNTNSFRFTMAQADVIMLEQELQKANALKQQLIESGKGYNIVDNTQSEEYKNLNNRLTNLINQGNILNRTLDGVGSVANRLADNFKHFTTTALSGIRGLIHNGLNRLKDSIRGTSNLHGVNFKKMLTQLLKYGFGIRSIFLLYKKLRTEIKKGLGIMGAVFPEIQADINNLMNSFTAFKASLTSAFQPIFSYVVPALVTLIDYLTSAMNAVANFFAVLTGQGYYYKATKGNNNYAQSVSNAGKAAKEANKELAEYDKLLVINQDNSGSGGGGGGGGTGDAGYQWEKVPTETNEFFESLKKAWAEGDWEGLGRLISDKLTEMMESIPWDSIYKKAENFGKNLAEFMNGLITPELFSAVGATIAGALNTALAFLGSFGETFSWTNFGESISAGINRFFKEFQFKDLVSTLNTWADGLLTAMITAVKGVKWTDIATNISTGIATIDASKIGWDLGTLVDSLVDALYELVSKKETWKNIGTKIADGINGVFEGFDGSSLAKTVNAIANGLWTALGKAIKNIKWGKIADDIISFIGNLDIGTIALVASVAFAPAALGAIKSTITSILTTTVAGMGGVSVGTIAISVVASVAIGWKIGTRLYEMASGHEVKQGMVDEIKDIWNGLFSKEDKIEFKLGDFIQFTFGESTPWNDFFGDIGEKIYDFFHKEDWSEKFKDIGNLCVEGLKEGIKATIFGVTATDLFKDFIDKVKEFFGIASPSKVFEDIGINLIEGLKKGITDTIANIGDWLKTNVVDKITGAWDNLKEFTFNIKTSFEDTKEALKTKYDNLVDSGTQAVSVAVSLAKNGWTTVTAWVNDVAQKGKDAVNKAIGLAKDGWNTVKDWVANNSGKVYDKAVGLSRSGWTTVKDWVANNSGKVYDKAIGLARSGWSTVKDWVAGKAGKGAFKEGVGLMKSGWKSVKGFIFGVPYKAASQVRGVVSVGISLFKSGWSTLKKFFGLGSGGVALKTGVKAFANGGIIKHTFSQLWDNIPKYASGTHDAHGTLFAAGEAGPEIVGHIGNRTEVLNKSQLAATMKSAVMDGMYSALNAIMPLKIDFDIPSIAQGQILPLTEAFMFKYEEQKRDLSDIKNLIEQLIAILTANPDNSNHEPIMLQLDGKVVAQVIWDENAKRYKQTGRTSFAY